MPANHFRQNNLLLFDNLVEIDLLVLDKIDRGCALGHDPAEGGGHVGEVAIKGLDIERTEGGIDVVRCKGCVVGMAREACCFLGVYQSSADMRARECQMRDEERGHACTTWCIR